MKKYGRLTIISDKFQRLPTQNSKRTYAYVKCICDCGTEKEIMLTKLTNGETKSCGCLQMEKATTHGFSRGIKKHKLYGVWKGMKKRCYNPKEKCFKWYGGRGITVCKEWINDPVSFIEWGESNGWQPGLEIDRENNNGNYEPSNCRFVSSKFNNQNRRSTKLTEIRIKYIKLLSKTKTQVELGKLYGVSQVQIGRIINNKTWKI